MMQAIGLMACSLLGSVVGLVIAVAAIAAAWWWSGRDQ